MRCEDQGDPQGRRVATVVPHNFAIVRSGQFWHESEPDQAQDYEKSLRPSWTPAWRTWPTTTISGAFT